MWSNTNANNDNGQICATYRFLDSCWPAFIQHRAALCVVNLKLEWEADWTDIICSILQPRHKQMLEMKTGQSFCLDTCVWTCFSVVGVYSQRHGRAVCCREFFLSELGQPAGSVGGSCHQTTPVQTTFCHLTWLTPTDLKRDSMKLGFGDNNFSACSIHSTYRIRVSIPMNLGFMKI